MIFEQMSPEGLDELSPGLGNHLFQDLVRLTFIQANSAQVAAFPFAQLIFHERKIKLVLK